MGKLSFMYYFLSFKFTCNLTLLSQNKMWLDKIIEVNETSQRDNLLCNA